MFYHENHERNCCVCATIYVDIERLTQDLEFTDSAEDFVSYEEIQTPPWNWHKRPHAQQTHMRTLFKILPARKQKEGFEKIQIGEGRVPAAACVPASSSVKKGKKQKLSLESRMKSFHDASRGTPSALTSRIQQENEDKLAMKTIKKEIQILTVQVMQLDKNQTSEFEKKVNELFTKQESYIEILERRNENLANLLARNLLWRRHVKILWWLSDRRLCKFSFDAAAGLSVT